MSHSTDHLTHVKKYGALTIHTANSESLPIKVVGDISPSLPLQHVFYYPHLATNPLFHWPFSRKQLQNLIFFLWPSCAGSSIGEGDKEGA